MTAPVFCPGPSLFRDCRRAIVAGIGEMPTGITEGFEEHEHSAHPGSAGYQLRFVAAWNTGLWPVRLAVF